MKENLAPIILFVYNRPEHTRKTLEALSNNLLADQSVLYIYCDGVSENSSLENNKNNELVKNVIREKKWCKEVIIVESPINKGLATSVINGVSDIVEKYGKIIVLEDDLLTAHTFLKFMNEALGRYVDCENVIQISGYSFPAPKINANNSSFFLPLSSTWGWATWKHSWDSIDFECNDYKVVKENSKIAYKFNFDGAYNYTKMFLQQMESTRVSSWGIRFYWNAFKNESLTLYPDKSLVRNIGWDNSGKHNDNYDVYPIYDWNNDYMVFYFPKFIKQDNEINKLLKKYIKRRTSVFTKITHNFISFCKIK